MSSCADCHGSDVEHTSYECPKTRRPPMTPPNNTIDEILNASPIDKEVPEDVWDTIYSTWTGLWTDAYGEWDERQPSDIYPLTELLSEDCEKRLKQALKQALLSQLPDKKTKYVEAFDNDGHRYQIPSEKRGEWYKWCEIPSHDKRSWDTPDYAERIDGMSVTDNRGYNRAIDDTIQAIQQLFNEEKNDESNKVRR